jgi:hypothetical protein
MLKIIIVALIIINLVACGTLQHIDFKPQKVAFIKRSYPASTNELVEIINNFISTRPYIQIKNPKNIQIKHHNNGVMVSVIDYYYKGDVDITDCGFRYQPPIEISITPLSINTNSTMVHVHVALESGKKIIQEKRTLRTGSLYETIPTIYGGCTTTGLIESLIFNYLDEKIPSSPVKKLVSFFDNGLIVPNNYGNEISNHPTKNQRESWQQQAQMQQGKDCLSCINLGLVYAKGDGVTKDEAVAIKWFKKAKFNPVAQYNLGIMYLKSKNESEAVEWFQESAGMGYGVAKNDLGVMYAKGIGVQKDEAKAVKLFFDSADESNGYGWSSKGCNPKAMRNIGFMYENGFGVSKSLDVAYEFYFMAAIMGLDSEAKKSSDLIEAIYPTPNKLGEVQRTINNHTDNYSCGEFIKELSPF